MAKVRANLFMQGLSGSLGDQFVLRHLRDGRTIVCVKPDFSNRKFSQEQLSHQQRFREAASYARQAAKVEPVYAELAAGTMKTAYNIALSDFFHPPVIHKIETDPSVVRVLASDNVRVDGVRITILDSEGNVLERGEAALENAASAHSGWWRYVPQQTGKVLAEARDLAGNVTETELELHS